MTRSSGKISSFFAGIGGFDLGFERAGFQSVFQCELNTFCNSVLEKHWSNVPRAKDIKTLKSSDIPKSHVWTAGFPCQDVSVARGSKGREGLKGKNSGLFFPFMSLVKEKRPSIILLENVVGLLSSHGGQDFRIILEELNQLGYAVAWRVMNSRYFGAPQSRPRVFICASLGDPELPLRSLYEPKAGIKHTNRRKAFLQVDNCASSGALVPRVAYCLAATSGRHTGTDWSRTYISYPSSVRRLTPSECEGIQGFPLNWTAVQTNDQGKSFDLDTPRYHSLGNAVAVPVIEWIAKRMKTARRAKLRLVNGFTVDEATSRYNDFKNTSARNFALSEAIMTEDDKAFRWQSGGYVRAGHCKDIKAPEAPSVIIEKPLVDVVERQVPDDRYFLSPNAAEGIIRRVDSQNRTLFGPMDKALRGMILEIPA